MKTIKYITLSLLSLILFSCDNIDSNDYIIYPEGQTAESTPITKIQDSQAILIEDYTGWSCTNCPTAANILQNLISNYNEKLVAMSVHAGGFAEPAKKNKNLDLRTSYGEKWYKDFGLTSNPIGVINRTTQGASKGVQKDNWQTVIDNLLSSTEHLMNINLGVKQQDNHLIISTELDILNDINFTTFISLVVVEDNIIGVQLNNDPTCGNTPQIDDYKFNHTLRNNGLIDLPLFNSISKGQKINKNFQINIDSSWQINNCKVIVFVTDAVSGEVIQTNEIKI